MTKEATLKALKTGGTVLIIGAAALILMPGLMTYVFGLGRILTIVLITLVVATIAGNIIFRLKKRTVQSKGLETTAVSSEQSQAEEAATRSVPASSDANVELNAQD
jgi:UPF0716 family protein affecting phage T7 exclusion